MTPDLVTTQVLEQPQTAPSAPAAAPPPARARRSGGRGRGRARVRGAADGDRAAHRRSADHRDRHLRRAPGGDPLRRRRAARQRAGAVVVAICRTAASRSPTTPPRWRRRTSCWCASRPRWTRAAGPSRWRWSGPARRSSRHARAGQTIVLTSTSYVGATRQLLVEPLRLRGLEAGQDVFVAFAPERIDPGVSDHVQLSTPRVIGGVSESCRRQASTLLRHTCSELHPVSSPEGAEMVKLYENTFRALNIALSFEIAEACREHGLDPVEVTEAAASKPFGFMAHYPSAGVGGHCIGVDPHYLTHPLRERGRPASLVEEAMRKLAGRPGQIVQRAREMLADEGRELEDLACPRRRRLLQARRRRQPRGAGDRDHLPAARRGGDGRVPRPAGRAGDGRRARSSRASTPTPAATRPDSGPRTTTWRSWRRSIPGFDYGWLRRVPGGARLHLQNPRRRSPGRCRRDDRSTAPSRSSPRSTWWG